MNRGGRIRTGRGRPPSAPFRFLTMLLASVAHGLRWLLDSLEVHSLPFVLGIYFCQTGFLPFCAPFYPLLLSPRVPPSTFCPQQSLVESLGGTSKDARLFDDVSLRFLDPDVALERASGLEARGQEDAALRLYVRILDHHPDYTPAMDAAAHIMAEMGDVEGAREFLSRSVELNPEGGGYDKYVLRGHLEHGPNAVASFEVAVRLLTHQLSELEELDEVDTDADARSQAISQTRRELGAVLAALAKVYLADMYDQPGALEKCEELLDLALRNHSDNAEACQALADMRMTQGRPGEALLFARRTKEICWRLPDGLEPTYDFRMVTSRLLVELGEYVDAVDILRELTREDEEDTEAWYLLGLGQLMLHKPKEAHRALANAQRLLDASPMRDNQLMEQVRGLLARRTLSEADKHQFWNPRLSPNPALQARDGSSPVHHPPRHVVGREAGAGDVGVGNRGWMGEESSAPLSPFSGTGLEMTDQSRRTTATTYATATTALAETDGGDPWEHAPLERESSFSALLPPSPAHSPPSSPTQPPQMAYEAMMKGRRPLV